MPLSRKITDETLARHNGPLSVWSPHHLNRIAETRGSQIQSRIILKNPYKSEALIKQALEKDIREMVIDSFEELGRIERYTSLYAALNTKTHDSKIKLLHICG
jgi:diaminopimelate decarboxylase